VKLQVAVDFLRRGDRADLTLWAAIEEALRWWIAERIALIDGVDEPEIGAPRLDDPDPLRGTLTQFLATASLDEPVHISIAMQQALRRWAAALSRQHNNGQRWPHPASRTVFPAAWLPR
jgi:hypothetical protein